MSRNIWILNHYASDTYFDEGGRHYWFAKYLKRNSYFPVVFSANSIHGKEACYFEEAGLFAEHIEEKINVPYVFIRARKYAGNGKARILNMVDFYRNVQRAAKRYSREKESAPDIILASSAHPLTLVAGLRLAKHFGAKCICEIRDLWPESLVAYGVAGPKNPAVLLLRRLEKWIYMKADAIVFTMEGAYDYIIDQGWEKDIPRSKVHFINNGVDLEVFEYNKEHYRIEDADLENPDIFRVIYTGSIRKANNIGLLLDAAKQIGERKVKFLIWGAGDELETLEKRIQDEAIKNVLLKGSVEKKFVPYIISRGDLNFLDVFDEKISRFGISSNKLFEYFAAGRPILISRMKCSPMQGSVCKISYEPTAQGVASGIMEVVNMSEDKYNSACIAAKEAACAYSFESLTGKLIETIEEIG